MRVCSTCKCEKDFSEFHKKGNGYSYMCKECRKVYIRQHYLNNKETYINKATEETKRRRDWFIELKSKLKCEVCGENHIACLDFHHKNPSEKEITVSLAAMYSKTKVLNEIEKCIVLCANCHRKLHYKSK